MNLSKKSPPLAVCAISALMVFAAQAATHTWKGAVSSDWSEPLNWEGGAPVDGGEVRLTSAGAYLPTNQDIEDLKIEKLYFADGFTEPLWISGKALYLKYIMDESAGNKDCYYHLANDIYINKNDLSCSLNGADKFAWSSHLYLDGVVRSAQAGSGIWNGGYGVVHLTNPKNEFEGYCRANLGRIWFYDEGCLGVPPAEAQSQWLATYYGSVTFGVPEGRSYHATTLAPTRSLHRAFQIESNGDVSFAGDLGAEALKIEQPAVAGLSVFRYAGQSPSLPSLNVGSINGSMLMVLGEGASFGAEGSCATVQSQNGSIDLNGLSLPNTLTQYGAGAFFAPQAYYPNFMNCRRGSESVLSGVIIPAWDFNARFFGGCGDIRLTGSVQENQAGGVGGARQFWKTDVGTLTLATTQPNVWSKNTVFCGGKVVLDHASDNTPKLPNINTGLSNCELVLQGGDAAPAVESVNNLDYLLGATPQGAAKVKVVAGAADATFSFGTIGSNGVDNKFDLTCRLFDFQAVSSGTGKAVFVADRLTNDEGFGGVGPGYTWNGGRSWVAVGENGILGPLPDAMFAVTPTSGKVFDAPAGSSTAGAITVNALRFDQSAGSTLELTGGFRLLNCRNDAALLMTPNSGDVTISGSGTINNTGYHVSTVFYQFSAGHTLRVEAKIIDTVNMSVMVAGPGKTQFVNDGNTYGGSTFVAGGLLEFTSVADKGTASSLGTGQNSDSIILSDAATFRYVGTDAKGHATDRPIVLNGDATVEANGAGPLKFTAEKAVSSGWFMSTRLTLSGSGEGEIDGAINPGFFGSLRKTGSGTWTIRSTDSEFSYPTEIESGTLVLDGALPSPVNVAEGATLKTAGCTLKRDLNLAGDLRFDPFAATSVTVCGKAKLSGNLKLVGNRIPAPMTILTAAGGVEGTFASVPDRVKVTYTATSVLAEPVRGMVVIVR